MSATGTNTPTTTPNVNAMGWTQADIDSLIRHLRKQGTKLHLGRCSVNVRLPNNYPIGDVNHLSEEDVINGNLNGREICRNSQCREAYDDLKEGQKKEKDVETNKKLERLEVLEKAETERQQRKQAKKLNSLMAGIDEKKSKEILEFFKKQPAIVTPEHSDNDSDSNDDDNGDESKETESEIGNAVSTMDITDNVSTDAGAGAGEEPEVKPKRKYNKKKNDKNDNNNA